MLKQKKFLKIFIFSVIVLCVLVTIGYFVYPSMSTGLAIRNIIKEHHQQISPEYYLKLKKIDIQKVYQTANPLAYWVVVTRFWRDNNTKEELKELMLVNIAERDYNSLSDLDEYQRISFISAKKVIVEQNLTQESTRYNSLEIFNANESKLTVYSDDHQTTDGLLFRFARKNQVYPGEGNSLFPLLKPLFDGECENDVSTNKFMISLLGLRLENKYNSNLQNIYFKNPIQVECSEYSVAYEDGPNYQRPIENSLKYEDPYIVTSLPGNVILKIEIDKLLTGLETGWPDPETMIQAFQDKTKIDFQDTQSE